MPYARWRRLLHLLELARIEMVLAAVSNSWLVIFLSFAFEPAERRNPVFNEQSLFVVMLLGAAVAAGLAMYGMALNDVVDARRDRTFRPMRPIPSGRIGLPMAVVMAVLCLLVALTAAVFLGQASMLLTLAAAAGILFYNAIAKFVPALGLVTLGLIHVVNMLIPNPSLGFAWPLWLVMSHVMACSGIAHVLEGKRPRLEGRSGWAVLAGWAFWTMALVGLMTVHDSLVLHARPGIWLGPLAGLGLFAVAAAWRLHGRMRPLRQRRQAGADFARLSLRWLMVYDAGWLMAAGLLLPGLLALKLCLASYILTRLLDLLVKFAVPVPTYRITTGPAG